MWQWRSTANFIMGLCSTFRRHCRTLITGPKSGPGTGKREREATGACFASNMGDKDGFRRLLCPALTHVPIRHPAVGAAQWLASPVLPSLSVMR